jgi:hypothetical protein
VASDGPPQESTPTPGTTRTTFIPQNWFAAGAVPVSSASGMASSAVHPVGVE